MKKPLAGIINISINNILSIQRALEYVGFDTVVINEYKNVRNLAKHLKKVKKVKK